MYRKLFAAAVAAGVLLSNGMCAVVAYAYQDMLCGIAHQGYSAPAQAAFLLAVPFGVAVLFCTVAAVVFYKKSKSTEPRPAAHVAP